MPKNSSVQFEPAARPIDPDFAARIAESFARQQFMKHLGAELAAVKPGYCEIRVPFREALGQQHGFFHAGVSGAIADSASGYAAFSLMPKDCSVLTVEYKLNLVAPARGQALVARAQVIRSGKTLAVCRAEVFGVTGAEEGLCATSLSTVMAMPGRSDHPPAPIQSPRG